MERYSWSIGFKDKWEYLTVDGNVILSRKYENRVVSSAIRTSSRRKLSKLKLLLPDENVPEACWPLDICQKNYLSLSIICGGYWTAIFFSRRYKHWAEVTGDALYNKIRLGCTSTTSLFHKMDTPLARRALGKLNQSYRRMLKKVLTMPPEIFWCLFYHQYFGVNQRKIVNPAADSLIDQTGIIDMLECEWRLMKSLNVQWQRESRTNSSLEASCPE